MTEWQPIETAPKDGTQILAAKDTSRAIISWRELLPADFPREDPQARWRVHRGFTFAPTHWQSLPDLPTAHPQQEPER